MIILYAALPRTCLIRWQRPVLFLAHVLAGGRTLAEVRDPAIHPDSASARTQVHIATDDGDEPGDLSDLVAQAR